MYFLSPSPAYRSSSNRPNRQVGVPRRLLPVYSLPDDDKNLPPWVASYVEIPDDDYKGPGHFYTLPSSVIPDFSLAQLRCGVSDSAGNSGGIYESSPTGAVHANPVNGRLAPHHDPRSRQDDLALNGSVSGHGQPGCFFWVPEGGSSGVSLGRGLLPFGPGGITVMGSDGGRPIKSPGWHGGFVGEFRSRLVGDNAGSDSGEPVAPFDGRDVVGRDSVDGFGPDSLACVAGGGSFVGGSGAGLAGASQDFRSGVGDPLPIRKVEHAEGAKSGSACQPIQFDDSHGSDYNDSFDEVYFNRKRRSGSSFASIGSRKKVGQVPE